MAAAQTPGTPETAIIDRPGAPAARPSLDDRMRDKGWTPEDVGEGANGEPRQEPGKAKPVPGKQAKPKKAETPAPEPANDTEPDAAAKPEPEKPVETDAEKLGARGLLEKLAKEQGFVIEDGKITTKQHAEFRLLKKEQREQLAQAEKAAMDRINEAQKGLEERFKKVEALDGALKSRDHQAVARALGFEDFDKFQQEVIAWNSDPNYQQVKELREWKAQQEREAEQAAQQRQAQEKEHARVQAENTYLGNLSASMKSSQDPLVQAMSDDPNFIRAVYRIQTENWDGRETVTPEQAVRMAAAGFRTPLGEEMRALYQRLEKVFGKKPEAEKPAVSAPKPKIAGGPKANPAVAARSANRNDRMRNYAQRLEEAGERDRKAGTAF